MEKEYKIQVPNNIDITDIDTNYTKGDKFVNVKITFNKNIPKDGDFIVDSFGCVFIYNGRKSIKNYDAYIGESINNKSLQIGPFEDYFTPIKGCRYATKKRNK